MSQQPRVVPIFVDVHLLLSPQFFLGKRWECHVPCIGPEENARWIGMAPQQKLELNAPNISVSLGLWRERELVDDSSSRGIMVAHFTWVRQERQEHLPFCHLASHLIPVEITWIDPPC
ncbi:unnamed protein product [Musa textilis]